MKGQAEAIDVLGIIIVVVIIIMIFNTFSETAIAEAFKQVATFAAPVVVRDLASFVTISGAAPENITIQYKTTSKYTYNVDVRDRVITVNINAGEKEKISKESGSAIIAVNLEKSLNGDNYFFIHKTRGVGGNSYDMDGTETK